MNILLTVLGWLLFNGIVYNIAKNEFDDKDEIFDFKKYREKKKDDWIVSLICAIFLLVVGHMGLGLDLLRVIDKEHPAKWSDLYYAGSGALYESLIVLVRKIKGKGIV